MKILLVAMSDSVHTARWISQINDQGWEIHLFPSIDCGYTHPSLTQITVHHSIYARRKGENLRLKSRGIRLFSYNFAKLVRLVAQHILPHYRALQLTRLIRKLKPDIIHTLETQNAGYLLLDARKKLQGHFSPWIHTIWGSDIYLFGRLREHKEKIREVLASCDYFTCEGQRDVELAREFGFKGEILSVSPSAGGFDVDQCARLRHAGTVSARRIIMLKGYQGWSGRGLVGLRALARCADMLKGYEIVIYSAPRDVVMAAELFTDATGIPARIVPPRTPHEDILKLQGEARISLGLSISDGVPNSMLEAMVMGAFPIQSSTACTDGWIDDGRTGILVPPEDPDLIEQAIRRALEDDDLVNRAAGLNYRLAEEKLNNSVLKPVAVGIYSAVMKKRSLP
jgi:glycosyltransferase involved in cell wall biosynthesis